MTDTNSLRTGAGYALEVGLYATHMAMTEAADTIDALRAENERLRACFDWANGAAEEGWLPAQEVRKLRAQLAEAQRDSERLDWLDKHCTGASDSERYLPRKIYWGGGSHRDVRAAIDAAKGGVK